MPLFRTAAETTRGISMSRRRRRRRLGLERQHVIIPCGRRHCWSRGGKLWGMQRNHSTDQTTETRYIISGTARKDRFPGCGGVSRTRQMPESLAMLFAIAGMSFGTVRRRSWGLWWISGNNHNHHYDEHRRPNLWSSHKMLSWSSASPLGLCSFCWRVLL